FDAGFERGWNRRAALASDAQTVLKQIHDVVMCIGAVTEAPESDPYTLREVKRMALRLNAQRLASDAEPVYQTKLPGNGPNVWRDPPAGIFNITPYEKRRIVYTEAAMVHAEEQLCQQREINARLCKELNAENGPTF